MNEVGTLYSLAWKPFNLFFLFVCFCFLFCFVLFCFVLFCFVVLFCFWFCFVLFCFVFVFVFVCLFVCFLMSKANQGFNSSCPSRIFYNFLFGKLIWNRDLNSQVISQELLMYFELRVQEIPNLAHHLLFV